jgi:hypothetical protein
MTEFSYGAIKTDQRYPFGSKTKDRRERGDRRWQSIDEGWDVSGPRWRIGWGGLDEPKNQGRTRSDSRH